MAKKFDGLIPIPATDGNFISGIQSLNDEDLNAMLARLGELEETEGGHKGRIAAVKKELKNRASTSKEIIAVEKMAEDIQTAEELYADGMPYELERIENEIRFYQDKAGEALLEMGKRLIRIKAHEGHGKFLESLERLGMASRSAQYAMLAARKFSNAPALAHLETSKMKALTVLADDDVQTLESGGKVNGKDVDAIAKMSYRELLDYARKTTSKLEKEKEARTKDREIQESAIAQKEMKINELDQQLRYQQPPTQAQLALAALQKLNEPYTFALSRLNGAIREAHNLVREAEKTPGVDALMLNEWLNQFDPEMQAFSSSSRGWLDEVDNAAPIEVGKILDGATEGESV